MWKPLIAALVLLVAACSPTTTDDQETTTTSPVSATTTTAQETTTTSSATSTVPPATTSTAAPTTTTPPVPSTTTTATTPVPTSSTTTSPNTPPTIEIISPEHLSAHVASFDAERADFGALVSLSAVVSDVDGDDVTVTWSSSTKGGIGAGEAIVAFISTNGNDTSQPTLTATATDARGATSTASVQIIVWIPSDV